jgi:hypothetical protein
MPYPKYTFAHEGHALVHAAAWDDAKYTAQNINGPRDLCCRHSSQPKGREVRNDIEITCLGCVLERRS